MQVRHEMTEGIRRMRPTFYFLGLLIGLSATLAAFKWETTHETVKIPVEIIDSSEVFEITNFKIIDEKNPEKTTKTKLVPPDPNLFKLTEKLVDTDTGFTEKEFENPFTGTSSATRPVEIRGPEFEDADPIITEPGSFPYFEGGDGAWREYINDNLELPGIVYESGLSTINIVVKCVVEKDGSLSNCSIAKDGGSAEAAEAFLKTLQKSPKWVPGSQNLKPVRVYVFVPLKIKLNR